uniref:(northern house mosquito) hypothetical protein n=1 Tax=Culex pipiens TaxID=7175 RepID=A0A8D8HAI0_CULPI
MPRIRPKTCADFCLLRAAQFRLSPQRQRQLHPLRSIPRSIRFHIAQRTKRWVKRWKRNRLHKTIAPAQQQSQSRRRKSVPTRLRQLVPLRRKNPREGSAQRKATTT